MPQTRKSRSFIIVIALSILLIALIIITSGGREKLTLLEDTLGQIVTPVQKVFYRATASIYGFFSEIGERKNIKEKYALLQDRVLELEKGQLQLEEVEKENKRLKDLLQFSQERDDLVVIGARVTGKNPGNWFNVFTIDKGKNQGIAVNMAVVNEKGLLGRVYEVGSNWSKVLTIVDSQSSVSGIVERNRDNGSVKGSNSINLEDGMCKMIYLPLESDIVPGDKVITSGFGGIFPKGIYIGEVKEVTKEKRDLYKTAIIQPGADFQRLEEVLVITASIDSIYNE